VFEHGMSYVCENSVANPKTCDFRSGKVILQQEIAREQMAKLLEEGRTDLLTNFKSSRTGRNFKAFLVKQNDGKIGFEFEKKEPSAKTAAKTAAAKSAAKAAPESDDGETAVAVKTAPAAKKAAAKKAPAAKTAAAKKAPAKKAVARKTGS
jgi:DNA topoisomerase-3